MSNYSSSQSWHRASDDKLDAQALQKHSEKISRHLHTLEVSGQELLAKTDAVVVLDDCSA